MPEKTKKFALLAAGLFFGACGSGAEGPRGDYCHYINPFSNKNECKEYLGIWSSEQMETDCRAPLLGMASAGTLNHLECTATGAVGTCTVVLADGRTEKSWYYGGSSEILSTSCKTFLNGTYEDLTIIQTEIHEPMPEAIAALASDSDVTIAPQCDQGLCLDDLNKNDGWFSFVPSTFTSGAGFVFWPGGGVDPRSYAVVARAMAKAGILVLVPVLPDDGFSQLARIKAQYGSVTTWYAGGHSHGATLAVKIAATNPSGLYALILWAGSASQEMDASGSGIDALFLWGTNDGRLTQESVTAMKAFLPPSTVFLEIVGGNHAQFGHYKPNPSDTLPAATISREEQQSQALAATLDFIAN